MELLIGGGLPPCSLAAAADFLSLVLCLLLLRAPLLTLAVPLCKEEEFPVGAMCCPKCRPGFRLKEACGEFTGTMCVPCMPGTYTAHLNGLPECLSCRVCDPGLGQVTRRNCSAQANTLCGCGPGHFCVREDGDACVQCRPHSACRPGQRVRDTGTEWQDTLCEDCQPGTFSAGGAQPACTPWTRCSGLLVKEATPGTNSSDATCSSQGPIAVATTVSILLIVLVIVLVTTGCMSLRNRKSRGEITFLQGTGERSQQNKCSDLQALPVQPDVTTEPVEETASMFPQRGPPAGMWRGDVDA